MKAKLRFVVFMACGAWVGSVAYEAVRYGLSDVDWTRATFISIFSFLMFLCVPAKWLGLEDKAAKERV